MFEGKVAIVTGGTRGIGAAITRHLAKNGARVAAGYSRGIEKAEQLRAELTGQGAQVSLHQGRVDDLADCERVIKEVLDTHGRVDFLVNNAGITVDKTVRRMTADDWQNVLNVNLFGSFAMIKAVLEHMIERGSGRIVNISSVIGETGNIGQANYAASKAGLVGLTRSLALEMAQRGITVNCVAPGFIGTEMVAAIPAAGARKSHRENSAAPPRHARGSRARSLFSARGRIELHYRRRLHGQRRPRHVMIPAEELTYGLNAAGVDPAGLGDAVKAVVTEAMSDPLRMSLLTSQTLLAQQTAGLHLLQRLSDEGRDAAQRRLG